MAKISFEVSARAGKLMGRENFSNPDGAIIELVKNSYDADAKQCFVVFNIPTKIELKKDKIEHHLPIKEKSEIFIIDNGEGMSEEVIKNYWMKIGTGNKEKNYLSDEKRVKTGAKGIGRFALDRLGFETEMWTLSKVAKNGMGSYWKMNWNQFDDSDKPISQINADLEPKKIDLKKEILSKIHNKEVLELINPFDFTKGTIIRVSNLKDEWFEKDIKDVNKSLGALIPPKELKIHFEVFFNHLQAPKEYGIVETAFFDDFDYKIEAKYNSETLQVDFEIIRNELDIKLIRKRYLDVFNNSQKPYDLETLENKSFFYSRPIDKILKLELNANSLKQLKDVGSFDLTFYYLKLVSSQKEGYPFKIINGAERRSVLDRFGGVKIYRDSFRVRPYGEPSNDWLRLGSRAVQSPASAGQRIGDWRVRPEQTAGIITISRKNNPLLIDKSDRGSLQENEAFETFKKIIIAVIHEFEFDRSKILNPFFKQIQKEKEDEKEKEIQRRAEELAQTIVKTRKDVDFSIYGKKKNEPTLFDKKQEEEEKVRYEKAFKETYKALEEEKHQKEYEEIVQVRALASLGLIVSSFTHELKEVRNTFKDINNLEDIYNNIVPVEMKKSIGFIDGMDIIILLKKVNEKIAHWVAYALTAIKIDKRKRTTISFHKYFTDLKKTWKTVLNNSNISLNIDYDITIPYEFRAFEMDLDTIFGNLIANSIDSFNRQGEDMVRDKDSDREIVIKCNLTNKNIQIIYSDNGIGLSSVFNNKEEIFLPFTTTKLDGTGLGMYLVKNVIEDNNGTVEIIDSKIGFKIEIKLPVRN